MLTTMILGRKEIRDLPVKCDNMERGCQWEGTVGTLEEHVNGCQFTLVPCHKKCKDDNGILKITRIDLQQHLKEKCPNRDYSCGHCGLEGTYAATLDHYDMCKEKIITCTNEGCTMKMERKKIKNHLSKICELTVISCKYMSIGCDVKLKRKDMRAHEQDDNAHKALHTKFKVTKFRHKKLNNVEYPSPSFYTSPNGYNMKITVYANGNGDEGYVSVYAHVIEGEYDDKLNWPFVGKVNFELLNQLEDKDHHSMELELTPEDNISVGDYSGCPEYIQHYRLRSYNTRCLNTQYLKDDILYFRISVEVSDHKPWLECTV